MEKNNQNITSRDVDFGKWYTDVIREADLVDYSTVKGSMIIRPYGYAIWENMQTILDKKFKELGHVNVQMPLLIPENLLKKEGELVEGFAPEVAWVQFTYTHYWLSVLYLTLISYQSCQTVCLAVSGIYHYL